MRHENRCALCNAQNPTEHTLVKGLKICTKCHGESSRTGVTREDVEGWRDEDDE